jgi:1,4-dihydroxy-2-naphthoyl-CoA hydrolase
MIWWGDRLPDLESLTAEGTRGLGAHLGIVFDVIGVDWLRAKMPVEPRTHQPFGRLHGGGGDHQRGGQPG